RSMTGLSGAFGPPAAGADRRRMRGLTPWHETYRLTAVRSAAGRCAPAVRPLRSAPSPFAAAAPTLGRADTCYRPPEDAVRAGAPAERLHGTGRRGDGDGGRRRRPHSRDGVASPRLRLRVRGRDGAQR